MEPILGLFVIVLFSLIINRIAAVMLTFTGLSREMAKFQARSAFSTVGFTTSEAETVVNHPVRRQIISVLMLLGNAGLVSIIATVIAQVTTESRYSVWAQAAVLAAGLGVLWFLARSKWVDDKLFRVVSWALKRFTRLEAHDFLDLLQLGEEFSVTELEVEPDDWLVGERLDALRLNDMGVMVLGIHRADGDYLGSPSGSTYIRKGDKLIVYGSREHIIELDQGRGSEDYYHAHQRRVVEKRVNVASGEDERGESYQVAEMFVRPEDWFAGKRLDQLRLGDLGVHVLGIHREDGEYVGSPIGSHTVRPKDKLIVYGARRDVATLDRAKNDPRKEQPFMDTVHEEGAERRKKAHEINGESVQNTPDGSGAA